MASKTTYLKCVECASMINDENMHCYDDSNVNVQLYAEFCYGCLSYNTEVVIAYR